MREERWGRCFHLWTLMGQGGQWLAREWKFMAMRSRLSNHNHVTHSIT